MSLQKISIQSLSKALRSCDLQKEDVLVLAKASELLESLKKKQAVLSDEEQARCARFVVEPPRELYIVSHVLLRLCLAVFLNCDPEKPVYGLKGKKKPFLLAPQLKETPLHFNLSHSEDYVALLFSHYEESGVDIQYHSSRIDVQAIANRFFSAAEKKRIQELEESKKITAFFRFWVIKEAVSKAMGLGMYFPMEDINGFLLDQTNHLTVNSTYDNGHKSRWALDFVDVTDTYSTCVATPKKKSLLRIELKI